MVRHRTAMVIVDLSLLTFTLLTNGIALSLDDELQELTANHVRLKEVAQKKNAQLEDRIRRLEDQQRRTVEVQQSLESHVTRLESKLQQHESRLAAFNRRPLMKEVVESDSNSDSDAVDVVHGMPTSCADLRQIGHVLNGFYSVRKNATSIQVYCNFAKMADSPGFQQWIEHDNAASSPIYFDVQRTSPFADKSIPIKFHIERIHVGRAMNNETSGKFTAPQAGTYSFIFSGGARFPASSSPLRLGLSLRLNNQVAAERVAEITDVTVADKLTPSALQATISLESGDEVWIEVACLSPGVSLHSNDTHFTCFNGCLLS